MKAFLPLFSFLAVLLPVLSAQDLGLLIRYDDGDTYYYYNHHEKHPYAPLPLTPKKQNLRFP